MTKQHSVLTHASNIFNSASKKSFCELSGGKHKKEILLDEPSKFQTLLVSISISPVIFCITFILMAIF